LSKVTSEYGNSRGGKKVWATIKGGTNSYWERDKQMESVGGGWVESLEEKWDLQRGKGGRNWLGNGTYKERKEGKIGKIKKSGEGKGLVVKEWPAPQKKKNTQKPLTKKGRPNRT